ncbi:MAG TPA: alpha/beta fold hydrolase, partial [Candidatus Limnocylindria bacterium]
MCVPPGARPPEIPADLLPISGGAGGEDVILSSADGATFRARLATAAGDAGVVIAPDVRGLHSFYEELAERFASAGVHAVAFDYFGRTAGTDRRPDDWAFQDHVTAARARPDLIQADVAASAAELRKRTGATRIFVLGFCMGGRVAFNASAAQDGLAGV